MLNVAWIYHIIKLVNEIRQLKKLIKKIDYELGTGESSFYSYVEDDYYYYFDRHYHCQPFGKLQVLNLDNFRTKHQIK